MAKAKGISVVAIAVVLLTYGALVSAHSEGFPFQTDLIAGQTDDVGDVLVWNDGSNLYVKFVVSSDYLYETHVHVATSLSAIPQTKKGNPIPGKFEHSDPHGCVTDYTYQIPLSWAPGTSLYIAAHAALGEQQAMTIVSGDGQTIVTQRRSGNQVEFTAVNQPAVIAWEPGPSYPNDGPDDSGWAANSLWDQNLSVDLRSTGADWIWESYRVQDPLYGTVLTLQRSFDIGCPIGGNLQIACDNGYEVSLNGNPLGSQSVYGEWQTSDLKQAYVDIDGWQTVGSYALTSLQQGTNSLTVDVANEYFNTDDYGNPSAGTQSSNPGACIFVLEVTYCAEGETGWGDGSDFSGRNWGMYFGYQVQ